MPTNTPACPECGTALTGVSQAQLEQHIEEKRDIICGICGAASRAKEWRDGKTPRTLAREAEQREAEQREAVEQREQEPIVRPEQQIPGNLPASQTPPVTATPSIAPSPFEQSLPPDKADTGDKTATPHTLGEKLFSGTAKDTRDK